MNATLIFYVKAFACIASGCTSYNQTSNQIYDFEKRCMESCTDLSVQVFWFNLFQQTLDGLIEFSESNRGYSLRYGPDNVLICSNVHYVKTLGGEPPTVKVYLINDRFVVYPETIRNSNVKGALYSTMLAVTHVFDLETRQRTYTSQPYPYDHDAPLVIENCMIFNGLSE